MANKSRKRTADKITTPFYVSPMQSQWHPMFVELFKNPKFYSLSQGAQNLWLRCYCECRGYSGRSVLDKYGEQEGKNYPQHYFTFPEAHFETYGIPRNSARRWLRELIDAGFIEVIERNGHRRKVNVYAFTDKWLKQPP